mmetsp:Transcript_61852/g.165689  ORF Transcript_61852/g.165689 Transcript_61852/m.165689 type:complete len:327 (-) Transcript_61852:910-1890(-)
MRHPQPRHKFPAIAPMQLPVRPPAVVIQEHHNQDDHIQGDQQRQNQEQKKEHDGDLRYPVHLPGEEVDVLFQQSEDTDDRIHHVPHQPGVLGDKSPYPSSSVRRKNHRLPRLPGGFLLRLRGRHWPQPHPGVHSPAHVALELVQLVTPEHPFSETDGIGPAIFVCACVDADLPRPPVALAIPVLNHRLRRVTRSHPVRKRPRRAVHVSQKPIIAERSQQQPPLVLENLASLGDRHCRRRLFLRILLLLLNLTLRRGRCNRCRHRPRRRRTRTPPRAPLRRGRRQCLDQQDGDEDHEGVVGRQQKPPYAEEHRRPGPPRFVETEHVR